MNHTGSRISAMTSSSSWHEHQNKAKNWRMLAEQPSWLKDISSNLVWPLYTMRNIRFLQNQSCKQRHKTTRSATLPVSHAASQGHSISHTTSQSCSVTRPLGQPHNQSTTQRHKATRSATQPVSHAVSQATRSAIQSHKASRSATQAVSL